MNNAKRISFPTPETMSAEQRDVFDHIVSGPRGELVGPLRAALHNPELANRWQQFGRVLRFETTLPTRLNELAILVTARRWNAPLEWAIHERDGARAGLSAACMEAIRVGQAPDFAGDEEALEVYRYARELVMRGTVTQSVYHAVQKRWDEVGVVELTAVIGYYSMVAMTLNAHHIPLPEGVEANLPTDGDWLFELPDI